MKILLVNLLFASLCLFTVAGCGDADSDQPANVAYYDREAKLIMFIAPQEETPAVHPLTGKKTLFPAMYCEQCEKWQPAPELEQLQHTPGAGTCPHCKQPLAVTGPLPEIVN